MTAMQSSRALIAAHDMLLEIPDHLWRHLAVEIVKNILLLITTVIFHVITPYFFKVHDLF